MEIITIISRKGGTSKTTTAWALGAGLMKKRKKVLFIDLDSQNNLTFGLNASNEGLTAFEVLTGKATATEAIQHTAQGDIIAGKEDLATADNVIDKTGKEYRLKEALESVKGYDYIVIDTPAQLGILTINALTASNSCIIPVQADIYSLQGIGQLNETIEAVTKYCNKALTIKGILLTRFNGRAIISKDIQANLNEIAGELNTKLFKTPIRESIAVKEAQAMKQDLFTYAPRANATKDYEAFINEFLKGK